MRARDQEHERRKNEPEDPHGRDPITVARCYSIID
jgi:hypothetical protein